VLALSQALEALDIGASSSCLKFAKALEEQGIVSIERLKKMPAHQAKRALEMVKMTEFQIDAIMEAIAPRAPAAAAAAPPAPAPAPAAAAAGALGRVRVGAVAAAGAGFARAIGSKGKCKGKFSYPYGGVAFDGEGNLVVADGRNHRIQVLRYSDGAHLRSFGSEGAGAGQFDVPWGIAFDGAGHIIVSEHGGHRVQVLRYSDGAHVRTFGSQGSGNGQLIYAKGIAVDGEGNVAVFDRGNARVHVSTERRRLRAHHRQPRQRQRAVRIWHWRHCV
jgi:hypothetical protein